MSTPDADTPPIILVADDEQAVRLLVGRTLQRRGGYQVVTSENGREALDRFTAAPDSIGLVILDRYMPVMNGVEALDGMRALRPDLPAILISGAHGQAVATSRPNTWVLSKPFDFEKLLAAVREAMAGSAS